MTRDATPADVLSGAARWCVVEGDALALLASLPDGCVDAVVTDPPYASTGDAADLGASVPCPFVSCKHHVALDVNERAGSIKSNFPDCDPDEIPHTCTLRVAERGGATLDDVAAVMNLTRERVRQIQDIALAKLRHALGDAAVRDLIDASEDRLAAIDARAAQYGEVETWSREYAPPVRAGDGADEVADAGGVRLW